MLAEVVLTVIVGMTAVAGFRKAHKPLARVSVEQLPHHGDSVESQGLNQILSLATFNTDASHPAASNRQILSPRPLIREFFSRRPLTVNVAPQNSENARNDSLPAHPLC